MKLFRRFRNLGRNLIRKQGVEKAGRSSLSKVFRREPGLLRRYGFTQASARPVGAFIFLWRVKVGEGGGVVAWRHSTSLSFSLEKHNKRGELDSTRLSFTFARKLSGQNLFSGKEKTMDRSSSVPSPFRLLIRRISWLEVLASRSFFKNSPNKIMIFSFTFYQLTWKEKRKWEEDTDKDFSKWRIDGQFREGKGGWRIRGGRVGYRNTSRPRVST